MATEWITTNRSDFMWPFLAERQRIIDWDSYEYKEQRRENAERSGCSQPSKQSSCEADALQPTKVCEILPLQCTKRIQLDPDSRRRRQKMIPWSCSVVHIPGCHRRFRPNYAFKYQSVIERPFVIAVETTFNSIVISLLSLSLSLRVLVVKQFSFWYCCIINENSSLSFSVEYNTFWYCLLRSIYNLISRTTEFGYFPSRGFPSSNFT